MLKMPKHFKSAVSLKGEKNIYFKRVIVLNFHFFFPLNDEIYKKICLKKELYIIQ